MMFFLRQLAGAIATLVVSVVVWAGETFRLGLQARYA